MSQIKLSIIVPIYNAENFLIQTVNSIYDQGLAMDEFEVLLINDGSTDRSLEICEEIRVSRSNVVVINQKKQGVCAARNTGMMKSKGVWIGFVDADDLLVKNGFCFLFNNFSLQNCDVLRFWIKLVYNKEALSETPQGEIDFEGVGYDYIKKNGLDTFCYGYLYNREWLMSHSITFKSGLTMGEDFLFCTTVLLQNPRVVSTSCRIYNYMIRNNSASTCHNYDHLRRSIESQIIASEEIIQQLEVLDLFQKDIECYKMSYKSMQNRCSHLLSHLLLSDFTYKEFLTVCRRLKKAKLLPITLRANGRSILISSFFDMLYYSPLLFPFMKLLYSKVFMPLFYPRINRN